MKQIVNPLSIAAATLVLAAVVPHAAAQPAPPSPLLVHAEDNEAVTVDQSGNKRYRLPPMPLNVNDKPQYTVKVTPVPITSIGIMYETADGLVECSTLWRDTCRPHTYGKGVKLERHWIVLRNGVWLDCHGPERSAKCIATVALNGSKGDRSEANRWATPLTR